MTTFTIARLTFRELARRKILIAALILGLAFLIVYGIGFYYVNKEIGDTVGRNPLENNEIRNFLFMAGMYAVKLSGGYHGSAHLSNHPLWRDFHGDNTDLSSKTCTTVGNCSRQMDRIHVYADIIFTTDGWRNDDFGLLDIGIYGSKFIRKLTFSLVERHSPSFCFIRGWVSALNSREWRSGVWSLRSRLHWWMDRAYWFAHQQSDCNQYRYYLQLDHPKRSTMETRSPRNVFSLARTVGFSPFSSSSVPSPLMIWYAVGYTAVALFLAIRFFTKRDL